MQRFIPDREFQPEQEFDGAMEKWAKLAIVRLAALVAGCVLMIALVCSFAGCATIDMDCATEGTQSFTIGGSNIGNNLISAGTAIAKTAGFMARAPGQPPEGANPACHAHYTYLAIWGTDSVVSQHVDPSPSTPTPVQVTVQLAPGTTVTTAK